MGKDSFVMGSIIAGIGLSVLYLMSKNFALVIRGGKDLNPTVRDSIDALDLKINFDDIFGTIIDKMGIPFEKDKEGKEYISLKIEKI